MYNLLYKLHMQEYVYSMLRIREELTDSEYLFFYKVRDSLHEFAGISERLLLGGYKKWIALHVFHSIVYRSRLAARLGIYPTPIYKKYGVTMNITPVLEEYKGGMEELHNLWRSYREYVDDVYPHIDSIDLHEALDVYPEKMVTGILKWYAALKNPPAQLESRVINISLALNFAHKTNKMGSYIGLSTEEMDSLSNIKFDYERRDLKYLMSL